MQVIGTDKD